MNDISKEEMSYAMGLHAKTPYFHSDFAHTDYSTDPARRASANGGASWITPPLEAPTTLGGEQSIKVTLWIGINAARQKFTASLSRHDSKSGEWASLAGASADTLHREPGKELPLPGQPMMATSSMKPPGFSVALPIEMTLPEEVSLAAGDMLRIDVSSEAGEGERIDHRIWHSSKWPSTVELGMMETDKAEIKFSPHPVVNIAS